MPQSLARVALLVCDYDEAIAWYTGVLGFTLIADTPLDGGKRWVLVAPPGAGPNAAALLLARAATPSQEALICDQAGGRVCLFLHTDDFARDHAALTARGVRFVRAPIERPYETVTVSADLYGNLWDLVQPAAA